ncbi:MAG: protein YgfX [Tahibacter sp.]
MKSAPAITFDYQPSRWLRAATLAIVCLACVSILLSATNVALQVAALGFAASVGIRAWSALGRARWRRIAWYVDGSWSLGDAQGEQVLVRLLGHSRRGSMLILRWQLGGGERFDAVLLPDNLDRETFRRLCVRLSRGEATAPA